jgi:hypothetical protein
MEETDLSLYVSDYDVLQKSRFNVMITCSAICTLSILGIWLDFGAQ